MKPRIRTVVVVAVAAVPVVIPAGAAIAAQPAPVAIDIHGRGDGHGVGLPQDGALALGRAGKTAAQILDTFYPGTTMQADRTARMHVEVWQGSATSGSTQISLPSGGRIYGPGGHVAVPAGGLVTLTYSGDQWRARLASVLVGTGGRSLPHSLRDDPGPSPDPSAGSASPDPSPSSPSASDDPTPTTAATTQAPAASASPSPSDPGQMPAPPAPSAAATTVGPSATVATSAASPDRTTPSAGPTAVATTGPIADVVETSVSGARLDIVPSGTDGTTAVVASGRSYRGQVLTAPGQLVNDVPLDGMGVEGWGLAHV